MNINNELFESIIKDKNANIKKEDLSRAKNGDISSLLNLLSKDDAKKVTDALNDKEKAKQILSSDAAKQILKIFEKGNGNG